MISVFRSTWALLLGISLLQVGNGLQGTLLGVRGALEGFSTTSLSVIMSAYFAGFLVGSRYVPEMIRRVGHVRVFAALGSFVSAALILFPVLADPISWTVLRLVIGFCFVGLYITAESWLNNATTNDTRGQALSLYVLVQMAGLVGAQAIFAFGDASGFILFIVPSVLVSLAFAPILLTASPVPPFEQTAPMTFREIYEVSPLGCVGIFVLGGIFSALFGMAAVYGSDSGFTTQEIAFFVAAIYVGGLVIQYPLGWLSDRMDRRQLIFGVSALGAFGAVVGVLGVGGLVGTLIVAFIVGGMANPLYALLLAYTNDYVDPEDMASASARLLFINGVGAVAGPLIVGAMMERFGPAGFFMFLSALLGVLAVYALWRMTQRAIPVDDDSYETVSMTLMTPATTAVTMEAVVEEWDAQAGEEEKPAA